MYTHFEGNGCINLTCLLGVTITSAYQPTASTVSVASALSSVDTKIFRVDIWSQKGLVSPPQLIGQIRYSFGRLLSHGRLFEMSVPMRLWHNLESVGARVVMSKK